MRSELTNTPRYFVGMAFATLIVLFPVVSFAVPPIFDYPNHYARLWLISGGINDPVLSDIYKIDWSLTWINSFIDLVAVVVGPFLGIKAVNQVVLSLGLLLAPIGLALLNRSAFGEFSWWNVLCFALCWNWVFLAGFINFAVGLGLALLAAAFDAKVSLWRWWAAFAARFFMGGAIIVAHPFGGLFYLALLTGLAAGERREMFLARAMWAAALRRAVVCGAPVVVALATIVMLGPKLPGAGMDYPIVWQDHNPLRLLLTLAVYFRTYDMRLDAVVFMIFVLVLSTSGLLGHLRFHAGLVAVALCLLIVAPFIPATFLGTHLVAIRLPAMAVLALFAGLQPSLPPNSKREQLFVYLSLLVIFLRTAHVTTVWRAAESDLNATRQAVATVEPKSAILPVQYYYPRGTRPAAASGRLLGGSTPNYWHYPSLAVVDRKAFIPWLFSAPGKQPLRVLHPWKEIAIDEGVPPVVDALTWQNHKPSSPLHHWRERFDYVVLINADIQHNGIAIEQVDGLTLLADRGFARLYRITKRRT
jgi:hypothetical protein